MKRTVFAVSLALVCFIGSLQSQIYNNNYFFSSNTLPNYSDLSTVKATKQVNSDETITVGYAREPLNNLRNDIVIVKTKAESGGVIWALRYGQKNLDERAFGLEVSYSGKDIIVVGTAQDKDNPTDWNAFAMRVEISTGNVLWSTQYGVPGTREEWRMVEKTFGVITPLAPTYFMVGSTSSNTQKSILYAGAIFENGNFQYLNRYDEVFPSTPVTDFGLTMVKNSFNKFIVAGTRFESGQPNRIFTMGIDPTSGSVSDKYLFYGVDGDRHFGAAIDELKFNNTQAYGLAFTTSNPGVETGVSQAITVMLLNDDREPKWVNYYWQKEHRINQGLAIYQSRENEKLLDVYTNTFKDTYNPGFLNVEISDGSLNYFLKYNKQQNQNNRFATAMVQTRKGYVAKALHREGENGFLLAGLANNGKSLCFEEEKIEVKEQKPGVAKRTYTEYAYGTVKIRKVDKDQVFGKAEQCDGTGGYSFRLAASEGTELVPAGESFHFYPNPIGPNDESLKLSANLWNARTVQVAIFNALGQQTALRQINLASGTQVVELETALLSSGLNLVTVSADGEVLYQARVIRH